MLRGSLLTAAVMVAAVTSGCYSGGTYAYIQHAHPSHRTVAVQDTVLIKVRSAHRRGDNVYVKTVVHNRGNKNLVIRRSQLGLRLGDGTVVQAPQSYRQSRPIVIRPGEARRLGVRFHAGRVDVAASSLVLSGVRVGRETPQNLGEVSLSSENPVMLRPPASEPRRHQPELEDSAVEDEDEQEVVTAIEPVEEDEADDDAEATPADVEEVEPWVIGGGQ